MSAQPLKKLKKCSALLAVSFLGLLAAEEALYAQFIRGGAARADVRGTSRRTARRVNRRHDYFYGSRGYYGGYYAAPVAGAAVAGAAAAAVLYSLPGGCTDWNGYYNCGGRYYQPQMQGSQVVYVEVEIDD